ncbi:MAG TPA: hypothetical protein VHK91_00445 [Flavisolibacter sp.]|nr:hypothetical protein [Flavisolibacter sp.]
MKKLLTLLAVSTLLFACEKEKEDKDKTNTFKSEEVTVYHGKSWSSVTLDKDGVPQQLALILDSNVLRTVYTGPSTPDHHHDNDLLIPIHSKGVEATPFKFIMLNWNPNGHEPEHVYDKPHFDIHFYLTNSGEVMNYTDEAKLESLPALDYLPANHVPGPAVPMMGKHWIDLATPELNGQPFTQTFLFGSYNAEVVFYEPMITLDFLKTTKTFERTIPQPAKVKKTGYYPTKMKVSKKDDGTTSIILDGFVKRQAS